MCLAWGPYKKSYRLDSEHWALNSRLTPRFNEYNAICLVFSQNLSTQARTLLGWVARVLFIHVYFCGLCPDQAAQEPQPLSLPGLPTASISLILQAHMWPVSCSSQQCLLCALNGPACAWVSYSQPLHPLPLLDIQTTSVSPGCRGMRNITLSEMWSLSVYLHLVTAERVLSAGLCPEELTQLRRQTRCLWFPIVAQDDWRLSEPQWVRGPLWKGAAQVEGTAAVHSHPAPCPHFCPPALSTAAFSPSVLLLSRHRDPKLGTPSPFLCLDHSPPACYNVPPVIHTATEVTVAPTFPLVSHTPLSSPSCTQWMALFSGIFNVLIDIHMPYHIITHFMWADWFLVCSQLCNHWKSLTLHFHHPRRNAVLWSSRSTSSPSPWQPQICFLSLGRGICLI